jgi:hypothetical protein
MRVVLEKKAGKHLERLNEPVKSNIGNALDGLTFEPVQGDVKKLQERKLNALRPLFDVLVDDENTVVIETDLTDEEHALIEEGVKHYHEHPEDFVPLESIQYQKR